MKYLIFIIILALVSSLFLVSSVNALTISPVRFEIEGDPGTTLVGEIELFNEQPVVRTFYSSFANFEARGEGGEPHFLPGEEGLAGWMDTEYDQVVLELGERKIVPFTITIPVDANPGGHFAAIFWGTTPPHPEGEGVVIGAKVGTLILLGVKGEIKEGGGILEFGTEERIFTSLPITFFYRFANDGGDRVMLKGEMKIRNIFGRKTIAMDANPVLGNVLPGSVRRFEVIWGEPLVDDLGFWGMIRHQWQNFAFGMYTANLNLFWGENMSTQAVHRFFVIPWQLLSVIIIIFIIIGLFGFIGIKKYNHWIIAKAKASEADTKT